MLDCAISGDPATLVWQSAGAVLHESAKEKRMSNSLMNNTDRGHRHREDECVSSYRRRLLPAFVVITLMLASIVATSHAATAAPAAATTPETPDVASGHRSAPSMNQCLYFWGRPTLRQGATQGCVATVQTFLFVWKGYLDGGESYGADFVDGIFGIRTAWAVMEFQGRGRPVLEQDAIVGPNTWQKMANVCQYNGFFELVCSSTISY